MAKLVHTFGTTFLPKFIHVDDDLSLLLHLGSLSLYKGLDVFILSSLVKFQVKSVGVVD